MSRYARKAFLDALAADKKANPELYRHAPLCPTAAETHANMMQAKYGETRALSLAKDKLADAPFLLNGDTNFWRDVVGVLSARVR